MHWVIIGSEERYGRDREGVGVGENLAAQKVQLKSGDGEENGGDGRQRLARGVGGFVYARVLVDGSDALAHSNGATVDSLGNVGGRGGEGDAARE